MADYGDALENFDSSSADVGGLAPCRNCGRTFMPESLRKHEPICQKSSHKPRKVFQSGKQRAIGSDVPINKVLKSGAPPPQKVVQQQSFGKSTKNWKAKHEEFVNTIRAARGVSKAIASGGPLPPPPPPAANLDYVTCPTCERRFNQSAAERHMPFCAQKNQRLPDKKVITDAAKRREAARKNYKTARPGMKTKQDDVNGFDNGISSGMHVKGTNRAVSASSSHSSRSTSARGGGYSGGYGRKDASDYESPAMRTGRTEENYNAGRQMRSGTVDRRKSQLSGKKSGGSSRMNGQYEHNSATRYNPSDPGQMSPSGYDAGFYAPSPPNGGHPSSGSYQHRAREHSAGDSRRKSASRFCHDCGNKFCRTDAKFCCECGMKRMYVH